MIDGLEAVVARVVDETRFSGLVRVDRGAAVELASASGLACRAHGVRNTVDTRFAIASGSKGLTALTVMSLVEDGVLGLDTPARSVLGGDLPLIDDRVTILHLLSHRSGIGDYLDEERDDLPEFLAVAPNELATTEQYLRVLDGFPTKFAPGARFSYCNGGFVVLALIAERASRVPFHELVRDRVCAPAGLTATAYLRSDELPGDAAVGYLSADAASRCNVFHLPVRGNGDGGIYSTVADVRRLWQAIFDGRILPAARIAEMVRSHSAQAEDGLDHGLGFWRDDPRGSSLLIGGDHGVSFRSVHHPATDTTCTVIANTSRAAVPVARAIREHLGV